METHGGVADTIATLASQLGTYYVKPIVILHNPVNATHPYVHFMQERGVMVWAITAAQSRLALYVFRLFAFLLWPVAILDAILRHKTVSASRKSVWGVLRRVGYMGLRAIFFVRLVYARIGYRASVAHFFKPDMWPAVRFIKLLGLKTLYTEETNPQQEIPYYYLRLAEKQRYIDGLTAVSRASATGLAAFMPEKNDIRVIPNMVDLPVEENFKGFQPPHIRRIAAIARFAPQKDLGTFLRACAIVHQRMPEIHFVIYGDGPERYALTELRQQLGLEEVVEFAGAFEKPQLPQILMKVDVLVLSSIFEGFPVTILEAMAFSKPVIATMIGGVSEVVENEMTGILVPPREPESLADAMCRLAEDPELCHRLGQAGFQRWKKHFTPEAVVPQYVEIYHALLSQAQR